MVGVPFVPDIIRAARAAQLAQNGGMPMPAASMPNAATPPPTPPPPPVVVDDSGQVVNTALKGDPEQTVNRPGKAALGEDPEAVTPPDMTDAAVTYGDTAPAQDDRTSAKHTSFFQRPGATDALTAFGAAMLKAPTFLQGLGDAALAVNAVERENRMPSEAEIARAQMKYRLANGTLGRGGYSTKTLTNGYADGVFWSGKLNGDGTETWTSETGETLDHAPEGFMRAPDSGVGQRSKDTQKLLTADRDAAFQANQNMPVYDSILDNVGSSGAGSTIFDQGVRTIASTLGIELGDVDLSDMQVFNKEVRNLELQKAQTQRGLGQFTEMERKLVQEALPSLDTQPATVLRVAVQMKLRDMLNQELYQAWMETPPDQRGDYEDFAYKVRSEQNRTYMARYEQLFNQTLEEHPELQKYVKDSNGSSGSAPKNTGSGMGVIPDAFKKYLQ
jgi:hypothetical protein